MILSCPVVTVGRAGSTYVRQLLLDNNLIILEEWFSPLSYNTCLDAGACHSKGEYLSYVYSLLNSRGNKFGVKITPDICATKFWGTDILADPVLRCNIGKADSALLLLRSNVFAGFVSMLYSEVTGSWHSNESSPFYSEVTGSWHSNESSPSKRAFVDEGGDLDEYCVRRILEMLDSEVRLVDMISSCCSNYTLIFYEDMILDLKLFSMVVMSHFNDEFKPEGLVMPNISKHKKDKHIFEKVASVVRNCINCNKTIQDIYKYRQDFLIKRSVFSHHFSLIRPFVLPENIKVQRNYLDGNHQPDQEA